MHIYSLYIYIHTHTYILSFYFFENKHTHTHTFDSSWPSGALQPGLHAIAFCTVTKLRLRFGFVHSV